MIGSHRSKLTQASAGYEELDAMDGVLGEDPELECARERLGDPFQEPQHGDMVMVPLYSEPPCEWSRGLRLCATVTIRRVTFRRELFSLSNGTEFWAWVAEKDGKVYL